MDLTSSILEVENLKFSYPGEAPVLNGLSFALPVGARCGLVGANGSGKTTLFHLLMGLHRPQGGRVRFFGAEAKEARDFARVRRRVGLLFQDADDQLFCPTVLEDVAFGPLNQGKSREEALHIARQTLDTLGLAGFEERVPHRLSGGEKKLVSLATVLSMRPELLLLDEPTTGLDPRTKERLLEILQGLELSYLLISHEMDFLRAVTDEVLVMRDGRIETGEVEIPHYHLHVHKVGSKAHKHD